MLAIFSYLCVLVIVPLVFQRQNQFVSFHSKQGVVLLLMWIISPYILTIPLIGWIAGPILMVFLTTVMIVGIISSIKGEEKHLPLIGLPIEKALF